MTEADRSEAAEALLRQALAAHAEDPARADFMLDFLCAQAEDPLPMYRVLYKHYNRLRRFDRAEVFARRALEEAGRRCGLPDDPMTWTRAAIVQAAPDHASQALLALKASAFLALRQGEPARAEAWLTLLGDLDPEDGSGVSVVQALAAGGVAA
jgi:hypothetical protein